MKKFRKIEHPIAEIPYIESRVTNKRFNVLNFTKYFQQWDNKNEYYYAMTDEEDNILSLAFIQENVLGCGEKYIAEIQSIVSGCGYGVELIQHIVDSNDNVYLMCDPNSKELYQFYVKNIKGLNSYTLSASVSTFRKTTTFFYKCEPQNRNRFIEHFNLFKM